MKINRLFYTALIEPLLTSPKQTLTNMIVRKGYTDVLEIGCGTGRQSIMLAKSGINVTCADISDSMFPENYSFEEKAVKEKAGKLNFIKADGRSLPFASGSFDAAVISLALHEMEPEYRIPILEEMLRLLKNKGLLYVMDYNINLETKKTFAMYTIKFIEWLAGKRHNGNFKHFIFNGGVPALAGELKLTVKMKIPIFSGSGAIFVLSKPGSTV